MTFPQPPWDLFGVYRQSEYEAILPKLESSGIRYQIHHEPSEAKPYCLWVHDDDLQLAADTLGKPN